MDIAHRNGQQKPETCKYVQGSDAASLLREKLRVQLIQVAAAYSTCLLCLEGSAAFELSVMSSVDELIALACGCGVALSIITAGSPAKLEVSESLGCASCACAGSLFSHLCTTTCSVLHLQPATTSIATKRC